MYDEELAQAVRHISELEAQLTAEKKKARELDVLASEQDATIKALEAQLATAKRIGAAAELRRLADERGEVSVSLAILSDIKEAINANGRPYLDEVIKNLESLIMIRLRRCAAELEEEMSWELADDLQAAQKRISELEAQLAVEKKKVADLEKPAAFGWQCYQDRCENAYIEQSVVRKMEAKLKAAREALEKALEWRMAGEPDDYNRCVEESLAALDGEVR